MRRIAVLSIIFVCFLLSGCLNSQDVKSNVFPVGTELIYQVDAKDAVTFTYLGYDGAVHSFQEISETGELLEERWMIRNSDGARLTNGPSLQPWRDSGVFYPFLFFGEESDAPFTDSIFEGGIRIHSRISREDPRFDVITQVEYEANSGENGSPAIFQIIKSIPGQIFPVQLFEMAGHRFEGHVHEHEGINRTLTLVNVQLPNGEDWRPLI